MVAEVHDLVAIYNAFRSKGLRDRAPRLRSQLEEAGAESLVDLAVDIVHSKWHASEWAKDLPSLYGIDGTVLSFTGSVEIVVFAA
jgi:hypothetical protein